MVAASHVHTVHRFKKLISILFLSSFSSKEFKKKIIEKQKWVGVEKCGIKAECAIIYHCKETIHQRNIYILYCLKFSVQSRHALSKISI